MTDKIGIFDPEGVNLNPLTTEPYSQAYRDLSKFWGALPAYERAGEILKDIRDYQLLILISLTGSGKTVIVPKLALDYTGYKGKIAISLPKRSVTLSAAMFSARTLDVELGKEVGYVYKGSDKTKLGPKNRLVYMTTGTLIVKTISDPLLTEFDVIILDEAHERSSEVDLLLLFLKKILESGKRPDLRVIIMSATLDPIKYTNYFPDISSNAISISGKTNYPIVVHFQEKSTLSYMATGLELIKDLVDQGIKKDMLFFITTSNEALQLCKQIRPDYPKVYCIEVYADMPQEFKIFAESRDKFLDLGNYDQKLIMATNVAESSITIDGLTYVIDSCYELYSYYDPETMGHILEKRLITKAQAYQRRGRVGRTEPGVCYHLVTLEEFNALDEYPQPEILKQDITIDILKIIEITETKTYAEGIDVLEQLMDVPKKAYIDVAHGLYNLYGITDADDKLTKTGSIVTKFSSLSINRSLFLIYAFEQHCGREASMILAMMDALNGKLSNLFFKADTMCDSDCSKASAKSLIKKLVQKKGDHLTFLHIYQTFKDMPDQKAWARKYGIRLDVLNRANELFKYYFYRILNFTKQSRDQTSQENPNAMDFDRSSKQIQKAITGTLEAGSDYNITVEQNIMTGGVDNRVRDKGDTKRKLVDALIRSHKHLTANKMTSTYPKKKEEGQIQKDSSVYYHYNRRELAKKKFIYDELVSINGKWEFAIVTLI